IRDNINILGMGGNFFKLLPQDTTKYVQAYEILFNRAQGKPARQSTTAFDGTAERAVDGNTNGDFFEGSVTHTEFENNPLWEVDLGSQYIITGFEVWNRTDCCAERLQNFWVFTKEDKFVSDNLDEVLRQRLREDLSGTFFSGAPQEVTRDSTFT